MEVWLIQGGKQVGPFQDYEIRSKIRGGDLSKDDFIWHDGLSGWKKLDELELFRSELEEVDAMSLEVADAPEESSPVTPPQRSDGPDEKDVATPPPLNQKTQPTKKHLMRRFWARWFDLMVYTAVWWLLMYVSGRDIGVAIRNLWLLLTMYMPWFAFEAWLIHRYGRTPGKWLLGLSVKNEDGSNLSLKQAIWRSIRVMISGIGFGWGILSIFCQGMSWFTVRRLGKPAWDFVGEHKVVVTPLNGLKIAALVVLFFVAVQLQVAVRGPHEQKIVLEQYPEWKPFFEDGKQWYFPVKK